MMEEKDKMPGQRVGWCPKGGKSRRRKRKNKKKKDEKPVQPVRCPKGREREGEKEKKKDQKPDQPVGWPEEGERRKVGVSRGRVVGPWCRKAAGGKSRTG